MNILIVDKFNKQILQTLSVFYNSEGGVWKVHACKIGDDPLTDGW